MKKRIVSLEIDVSNVKTNPETLPTPNLSTQRTCQKCNSNFPRTCDLENHMIAEHNVEKKHKCSDCGKHFLFKWILRKHVKAHNETAKTCRYFTSNTECPFEELGCKFRHEHLRKPENFQDKQEEIVEEDIQNEVGDDDCQEEMVEDENERRTTTTTFVKLTSRMPGVLVTTLF